MSRRENQAGMERPTLGDWLLGCAFVLAAGALLWWSLGQVGDSGAQVEIVSAGQVIGVYPLDEEAEFLVEQGSYHNIVHISQGQATVTEANCPDQYCVRHEAISRTGETIVCLPARLVVKINRGEEAELDGIAR